LYGAGAGFSDFFEIPVLGDLLGQIEALFLGAEPVLPAANGRRALPGLSPAALKNLQLAVHEFVRRHAQSPRDTGGCAAGCAKTR
jgi:hypothetical protein